jgi:hypothetical protein
MMCKQMSISLVELLAWARLTRLPITIIGIDLPKSVIPGKRKPGEIIVPLTASDNSVQAFDDCIDAIVRQYKIKTYCVSAGWVTSVDGTLGQLHQVTLTIGEANN